MEDRIFDKEINPNVRFTAQYGLVNDKQELNAIDICSLFEKLFPNEELEIRFFGVAKIKRRPNLGQEILDKSIRLSDNLCL